MKYNLKKDKEDSKDYRIVSSIDTAEMPTERVFSLWPLAKLQVCDQGAIGSCGANAFQVMAHIVRRLAQKPDWNISRLMLYYETRNAQGMIGEDSGVELRELFKTANKVGVCAEKYWPYTKPFTERPYGFCYGSNISDKLMGYYRVDNDVAAIKTAIFGKNPVVIGMMCFEAIENVGVSGIIRKDMRGGRKLGGHAMCIVGWDDSKGFEVMNSWGADWGDNGRFWLGYKYIKDPNVFWDAWVGKY